MPRRDASRPEATARLLPRAAAVTGCAPLTIGSILALIFGYLAKKQIRESRGLQQGGGLATAGIVLGWVGVGVLSTVAVLAIIGYVVG